MKKVYILISLFSALAVSTSCDHITNPFPAAYNTDMDTTIYPGVWSDYLANELPDWTIPNDNPDRNAIIEDYTGHNCSNCPQAATIAHDLHVGNPNRVYVASIHSSSVGLSAFQELNIPAGYTINFTNENALDFGEYFGTTLAGSGFFGNPSGTVNRKIEGTEYFYAAGFWSTKVNEILALPLRVAIKAKVNYYPSTKGLFLHTEIENLDSGGLSDSDLGIFVFLIEDTLVGPQNVSSTYTPDYVHRDIMRGNISGFTWGRDVDDGDLVNGKYYLDYSYYVPDQLAPDGQATTYNADNMHLLVMVYDKVTHEVHQVIKKKIE